MPKYQKTFQRSANRGRGSGMKIRAEYPLLFNRQKQKGQDYQKYKKNESRFLELLTDKHSTHCIWLEAAKPSSRDGVGRNLQISSCTLKLNCTRNRGSYNFWNLYHTLGESSGNNNFKTLFIRTKNNNYTKNLISTWITEETARW